MPYGDLDSYLDELAGRKSTDLLQTDGLDSYLDLLAQKKKKEEEEEKKRRPKTFQEVHEAYRQEGRKSVRTASAALYDWAGRTVSTLDWLAQQKDPLYKEYRKVKKGIFKPASEWLEKTSEQVAAEGHDPESLTGKMIWGATQAIPEILTLKGLGAAGLGHAALPMLGAARGGEEGGWLGALVGAGQGAALGKMLGGVSQLPSVMRPAAGAVVFGGPTALAGGDLKDVISESVIGAGLSFGGPRVGMRDYFAKPLKPFSAREINVVKRIKNAMDEGKFRREIGDIPLSQPRIRQYGVESPEFNKSLEDAITPVLESHHTNGGATFNLKRGNMAGKDLYAVSIFPDKEVSVKIPGKIVTPATFRQWAYTNRDLLKDPRLNIGTWYDAETDTSYLDIVAAVKDRNAAIWAGQKANQKEITHLKNLEGIKTGGTGEDPGNLGSIYDRLDRLTQPAGKKQKLIRLFHFSRNINEPSELIDPHAMGTGQIGEESKQINSDGTFKPGYLPKSGWYSEESSNVEGHRWFGANVYETLLDKDALLIIPRGKGVQGNPDTLAAEANKIGWFDESTGQARLISPVTANKLGTSLTQKGKTVSGKEIYGNLQLESLTPAAASAQVLGYTGARERKLPQVVGWEFTTDKHLQGVMFVFKRYPILSSLVKKIKFVDEMPRGSASKYAFYRPDEKEIWISTLYVPNETVNEVAGVLGHEIRHAITHQRMSPTEFKLLMERRRMMKEAGVPSRELPPEREAERAGWQTDIKYFESPESAMMTGNAPLAAEQLRLFPKTVVSQERAELGLPQQPPAGFKDELEQRAATGGLSRSEQKLLEMIKEGKVGEDEAKIRAMVQEPEIKALLKRKPREVLMALETELVDRFAPARKAVEQFEEIAQKSIDFDKNIYNLLRLFPGRFGVHKLAFDELREICRPVSKYKTELQDYGIAERAKERWERDIENPEYAPGKHMTKDEAIKAQADIANRIGTKPYQKVMEAHAKFTEWSDRWILQTLRDSNLISPKLYASIRAKNKSWFPFEAMKYVDESNWDAMPVGSEFFSVRGQDIVRPMTGGSGKIVPPFESILSTLNKTITIAEKNKILVNLVKYRALSPEIKKLIVPIKMSDQISDPNKFEDIKVVLNGKVTRWLVPKDLGSTLKRMDMRQADSFMKIVKASSSLFRAGTTSWYLPFTLGNAPRDFKMALLCSTYGFNPVNWTVGLWHGLRSTFGFPSGLFKEYLKSRGAFGGFIMRTPRTTVGKLFEPRGIEVAKEAALFIKNIASAVELAPRLGVFQRAMGKGFAMQRHGQAGSLLEAGLESRQATIDFSKAGMLMKVANQYVPFINARLQAKVNLFNKMTDPETRAHTMAKAIAWVVMPSLSAYLYNILQHPDTYSEIPDYVKDNYDIVILGTTRDEKGRIIPDYAKLTKGDVEQVFVNPLITFLEFLRKKEPMKVHEMAINWFSEMSPVPFAREGKMSLSRFLAGGISPLFRAPIEYVQGKSLYTEREIIPWELKRLRPEAQFTQKTPGLYRKLGKIMKASPLKLQALAKNIGGAAFYWPSAGGMVSLLAGRVRSTTGGERMNNAYRLQKKAEEGYFTTRKYIEDAISKRNYSLAYSLQNKWNREFVGILMKMSRLTGQRLYDLYETPFYKMYSFQDKDMKAIERGKEPEKEQESWLSGLEKKLGYEFYNR